MSKQVLPIDLDDYLPVPETVTLMSKNGARELEVHGLDITEVAKLLYVYKDLSLKFAGSDGQNFQELAMTAPEAVLDIIMYAIKLPLDQRDKIKKIPMQTQLEILEKAYKQTVPDQKKLRELLSRALNLLQENNKGAHQSKKDLT